MIICTYILEYIYLHQTKGVKKINHHRTDSEWTLKINVNQRLQVQQNHKYIICNYYKINSLVLVQSSSIGNFP
jgi:hypothetical protein